MKKNVRRNKMRILKKSLAIILTLAFLVGTFSVTSQAKAACKHAYKTYVTQATISKNGSTYKKCTKCGAKTSKTVIYKIKSVKLSATSFVYDGKEKKPTVKVVNANGGTLKKNKDYTIQYASGSTKVGSYSLKVTFTGKYKGSKTLTYKIVPKGTTIKSLSMQKNGFTVKWGKQAVQSTGYQIQYSLKSNFSASKTLTVKSNQTTSANITKLGYNQKYYVRIRTFKTVSGENYYSSWSSKKTVSTEPKCSLIFDREDLVLFVGETEKINCTVSPQSTAVTWKSSDTSVAIVSSVGTVAAVGEGTATITASFVYNATTYKDTCKVTVERIPDDDNQDNNQDNNQDDYDAYDAVREYIRKNGDIFIRKTDNKGVAYGGIISLDDEDNISFFFTYECCSVLVTYKKGIKTADLFGAVYSDNSKKTQIVIASAGLNVSTFKIDDDISFDNVKYRTGYASVVETGLDYIRTVTRLGFLSWNEALESRVDVSLSDIGFKEV